MGARTGIIYCLCLLGAVSARSQSAVPARRLASFAERAQSSGIRLRYIPDSALPRLRIGRAMIYAPSAGWLYNHHASITKFKGWLIACWSDGMKDEDAPGQRVVFAVSKDFYHWSMPQVLAAPGLYNGDTANILTAAGFHHFGDTLVAYYGSYSPKRQHTRLWAKVSTDGRHWSSPLDMQVPVNPNHGPQWAGRRLIISGNFTFPYTDDPRGLSGWKISSFYPDSVWGDHGPAAGANPNADAAAAAGPEPSPKPGANTAPKPDPGPAAGAGPIPFEDNPATFYAPAARCGLPPLCEGSFFQTGDSVLHMLLRVTGKGWKGRLWLTESRDGGVHWSFPAETAFPDNDSKFHFGKLPDGRYYYVGIPDTLHHYARTPLVLALSGDGKYFDRSWLIADEPYALKKEGLWKGGQYGYPHTLIDGGYCYVIISRQKEAIEVLRFPLDLLKY